MKPYSKYILETIGFSIVSLVGFFGVIYFLITKEYVSAIICLLITYVSIDNFFCSSRLKKSGIKAKGHYTLPPFLKRK